MNDNNSFDLLYIFKLLFKKKKFIILTTLAAVAIAAIVVLIAPKKYTSSSIFIVKNPILLDRNYVFRTQMYENKEFFAVPEDVDQVELISKSEAMIRFLVEKFDLANYYGIKNPYFLRMKIKNNFAFSRQDTKNIEIFYTDKDPEKAREITLAIRNYIEDKFLKYFIESNRTIAEALRTEMLQMDSTIQTYTDTIVAIKNAYQLNNFLVPVRGAVQTTQTASNLSTAQVEALEQLQNFTALKDKLIDNKAQYLTLVNEFEMVRNGNVNIFYLVQDAYTPDEASHPKSLLIILGTLIGSLFIASIIVVFGAFYREKIKD